MSRVIDEYVASMQFDNKNFERNVGTTLTTLDKLKQKLNFTGAGKGLENVNTTAKNINFSGLSSGVDSVKMKFSALEVMAVTALSNITNSAVNAGKRLAAAFTIEPIKTGFQEYETQIGAVQTILANTQHAGTDLDDVNAALDELNTYADKTIYNFTEMTRNIGTFTAAGVDLDKSVQSIKGIANLAAVSGSTSQQASTAMYQLSQALAAGKVSLMDWNSVVNAGMGGKLFQDALIRTSELLKTGAKEAINTYGSFRESLTKGEWLTTEVLTETLAQLSGAYSEAELIAQGFTKEQAKEISELADTAVNAATKVKTFTQLMDTLKEAAQSGWTQTWELLIGDFEQAKALWTSASDVLGGFINATSESRNKLLGGALQSNWEKLTGKIEEAGVKTEEFEGKIKEVAKSHNVDIDKMIKEYGSLKKAFQEGAISSDILSEALDKVGVSTADLSKINKELKFDSVGEDVKQLQTALKDLGYDLGHKGVDGIIGQYTEGAIKAFQKDQGLEVTGIVDEKTLAALKEASDGVDGLRESCSGLIAEIDKLGGRDLLIQSVKNVFKGLVSVVKPIKEAFSGEDGIFPKKSLEEQTEKLYNLISSIEKFTSKLTITEETSEKLRRTFKGLFAVVDIIATVVGGGLKTAFKIIAKLIGNVDLDILSFTASLGDALVAFRDWLFEGNALARGFDKLIDIIGAVAAKIRDFVKAFLEMPGVQTAIENIKTGFAGLGNSLKGRFTSLPKFFKSFIIQLKSMESISLSDIGGVISDFFTNLYNHFIKTDTGTIFDNFINSIKNLKDKIVEYLENAGIRIGEIVDKIKNFINVIKENVSNNLGGILAIGVLVTLFVIIKKIKDAIETIAHPLEFLDDLGEGLKRIGKAIQTSIKAQAVKSLATSIAIIAGSIFVLAMVDWRKLVPAVVSLVVVMGLLMGALALIGSKKMGLSDNLGDIAKLSGVILSLGASLLLIAYAAKVVSDISWEGLSKGAYVLAGFTTALAIMCASLKMVNAKDVASFGSMILGLSASLLLFSVSIGILGSMDFDTLLQGGLAVTAFLGTMVGMMAATKLLAKDMPKFATTMAGLGASLLLFTISIGILGNMDKETLIQGGIAVAAFLGTMVGMMAATKLLAKDMPKFGSTMLGMSVGLLAMAAAVGVLGNMDRETLEQGAGVIVGFMALMAAMMAATKLLGKNASSIGKMGVMMLGFGASMMLLTGSIAVLGLLDPADVDKGVETITKLGVLMGALMVVTRFAKDIKMGSLIGISVSIGVLAISVAALSFVDPEKLKSATTALGILMGMFAVIVAATSLSKSCTLTLIIMTAVVAALAVILYKLSDLPVDNTLATAKSLSVLLLSLSGAMLICSFVPAAGALSGIASLAIFIAGIGLIMAAIAGLAELFPGMEDFLNNAIPILDTIGYALGSFVGNIVGGFLGGATSGFPEIGENLSAFMTNLKPFIDGVKQIDETAVEGVKALASMMIALTGARLLDAVTSWITGGSSLVDFANQLIPFGVAITEFSRIVSAGVNEEAVTAAANAGKVMAAMADTLPNSGGVVGFFAGENDMSTFATQLVPFGTAITEFSSIVSGNIDEGAVEAAANAGTLMATMAANIPNTGGVVGFFAGDNDMVTFGSQLSYFGQAISNFSNQVSGQIDAGAVEAAANAGTMMSNMANTLPNSGGIWSLFAGDNDMFTFGTQLVFFGKAIKNFSNEVTGLDVDAVGTAALAGSTLATMANSLPESGGLWSVFSADNDMSTFAKEIVKFGEGISSFSEEVSGIDNSSVSAAATAGLKLAKMAESLPEGKTLDRIGTLGKKIKGFGEKLSEFADSVSSDVATKFTDVANGISKLAKVKVDNADTIQSFVSSLGKISTEGIDKFVASFKDSAPKVIASVNAMLTLTAQAIRNKGTVLKTAFQDIAKACPPAMKSQTLYTQLQDAGKYLVQGFASGISANTYLATAKAVAMATAAVNAAKKALKINSPSKVMIPIGGGIPEGLAVGIDKFGGLVKSSVYRMSDTAFGETKKAMSRIADVINSDIDSQPTIRPVMDLSDVYSGVGRINGMMSNINPSSKVMTDIGAINSTIGKNTSMSDSVASAIKDLKKVLSVRPGDTFNINGITYDDGSDVSDAVKTLVRAARMESRV